MNESKTALIFMPIISTNTKSGGGAGTRDSPSFLVTAFQQAMTATTSPSTTSITNSSSSSSSISPTALYFASLNTSSTLPTTTGNASPLSSIYSPPQRC